MGKTLSQLEYLKVGENMNKDSRGFDKRLNTLRKRKTFKSLLDNISDSKSKELKETKELLQAFLDYTEALEEEIEMIRNDIAQ